MNSSNTKQTINHIKCLWIMSFDSEKVKQTVGLWMVISWAMKLGFDCKSFLTLPAMYLNHYNALNHVGTCKTVFKFSWFFSILAMAFCNNSHVQYIRVDFCIYNGRELGYNLAKKSMELWFQYLIENQIFFNLFDWRKLLNLEFLTSLIGTRNLQHILVIFASWKDCKTISWYFPTIKWIKWINID